jgi:hypothetical protein
MREKFFSREEKISGWSSILPVSVAQSHNSPFTPPYANWDMGRN